MENLPDMSVLMRLAQSPAGQELIRLLQQSGGAALDSAVAKASAGDFSGAKETLSALLSDPKAQALLQELEGTP